MAEELIANSIVNPVLQLLKRSASTVVILLFISGLASLYLTPLGTLLRVWYVYTCDQLIATGRGLQLQFYKLVYPPDHPKIGLFGISPSQLSPARSLVEHILLDEYSQLFHSQILNNIYEYHLSRVNYIQRLAAAIHPILYEMKQIRHYEELPIDTMFIEKLQAAIQATPFTATEQFLYDDFMAIVYYLQRTALANRPRMSQFCFAMSQKLKEFEIKLQEIPNHYYRARPYYKFFFTLEKTPVELQKALVSMPARQLYGHFLQFERLRSSLMALVDANPSFDDAATVERFTARLKTPTLGLMTPIHNYFLDAFDNLIDFRQDLKSPSHRLATTLRHRLDSMELAFIHRLFPYIRSKHLSIIAIKMIGLIFLIYIYFKVL